MNKNEGHNREGGILPEGVRKAQKLLACVSNNER